MSTEIRLDTGKYEIQRVFASQGTVPLLIRERLVKEQEGLTMEQRAQYNTNKNAGASKEVT